MAHCPTAVEGADTTITDVEGGVQLLVVSKDEKATADIRARSKALLEAAKTQDPAKQHTGSGGGKGLFGHCTIIMHGTTLDVAEAPGGNKITVKAKDPKEVDWLRRETRERQATSHAEGSKGMGAHRMAHCPSAVTGATTKVTDTKDGVMVTVTGKGDDVVKDIRERAKKLVEASKYDAGKPEHTGEGHGGGGLGRCPVVLLDTTVEAKDVEGGSQLTVKADKKDGVAALQKESHDRAQVFAAAAGGDAGAAPAASGSAASGSAAPAGSAKK
jgi:TusA-related sulfurtransferase